MPTDWNKIRLLLNTVIDSCEQLEDLSLNEAKRSQVLNSEQNVTVSDLLTSMRTYPENLSYSVIAARHDLGQSKAYTSDMAHALVNTAKLCAELLEFDDFDASVNLDNKTTSVAKKLDEFIAWNTQYIPSLLEGSN